jgi:predicted P-loop ATPase/phage/plasmid primase-like uncharacterized protein
MTDAPAILDFNRSPPQQHAATRGHLPVREIAARLNDRIADLARELLGEPNRTLSTASQLRFGTKGSVAVEIAGPDAGRWYDHEHGVGGDGLEMIRHHHGLANGAACDWARNWLGLDIPTTTKTPAQSAAHTPEPSSARPDRKTKEELAAKVAGIIAHCQDVAGTPAETYLRNRGITAPSLPPALRFLSNAYGRYGALVALATDADGAVHGVQQIYVTEDGRKAPLKVQKRTNKAHDGWSDVAAVRLPGTAPIVLAEGVETALSVWQATGQETWACLGISNIARAPVPDGTAIIVARDGDEPGSKADHQLRRAVTILRGQGREVAVAEPPAGQDFNDILRGDGEQAIRDVIAGALAADAYSEAWRHELLINNEGEPRPVLANAIHALRHAPEWEGVLWHNEFATATIARKPPPWIADRANWQDTPWSDRDDLLVADWMQRHDIMVPASVAGQAIEAVARDRMFHPVREYLDGLRWDGVPRIETWLSVHLGAADTPYIRAVGPRWLISAVARIYIPGVQADCALILEGPQGIRKSSALRVLAQPWFTDRLSDLGSKDAAMETKGVWIIEIAELDTMSRAEVGTIKAFISRTCDRFRPPYGKRLVDLPRQCVFAGSVNPEGGYLKDATGGRRFWPVVCGAIDMDALERDRDQLWAEARDRFRAGAPWWLENRDLEALAVEQQADRYQGDAWDEPIRTYLDHATEWMENGYGETRPYRQRRPEPLNDVSVAEIMEKALGMEKGRWTQADQNRVVRSLVSMGFQQYRARHDGQRERRYRRVRLAGEQTR